MIVQSTRFGELDVPDGQILDFPQGVLGFPAEKRFALMEYKTDSPFYLLQSLADADLTFLMINPFAFFNDYEFAMDDALMAEIGVTADNPPSVFNIATVKDKIENMTVNLAGPVLVNLRDRKAAQWVIEKTVFPTKYALFPATAGGK
ncbi:MAG: flagellar assembly protein FliW [Veillonellaceae bacterium]|jgi:flagellar assembly factor FliW|nr:flagellar assembly protein FliW [Veillonellaceae bacterium]